MNQLDTDRFNKMISEFDSKYGEESKEYKDTILALSLIMLRGKELRDAVRKEQIQYRYSAAFGIIKSEFKYVQHDKIKFALFREGIISYDYIKLWSKIFYWVFFIIQLVFILFVIPNTHGKDGAFDTPADIFIFKITCVIISVFLSAIISLVFEKWTETYGNSYFGLGHRK